MLLVNKNSATDSASDINESFTRTIWNGKSELWLVLYYFYTLLIRIIHISRLNNNFRSSIVFRNLCLYAKGELKERNGIHGGSLFRSFCLYCLWLCLLCVNTGNIYETNNTWNSNKKWEKITHFPKKL